MLPTLSPRPRIRAALSVAHLSASRGVNPASAKARSSSIREPWGVSGEPASDPAPIGTSADLAASIAPLCSESKAFALARAYSGISGLSAICL